VVSEYEPGVEPAPWRFPARNRIIAGLSEAVVVVEARERSGALITTDFALEEGREVFAVPGEITSALSAGTNALLKLGATPLTGADDVLDALGIERAAARGDPDVSEAAERVLALVRDGPAGPDELASRASLEAGSVSVVLTELELAGLVAAADGVYRAVR
jgi:DNA processing protein